MRCGLLGKTLGHSYSPALHAMLGDYSYALFEKTEAELPDFLRGGGWDGLNVTIPYKKAVVPYCAARRRSGCKASTPWSAAPTAPSTATTRTSRASSSSLTAAASTSGAKRPWCWAAAARR